MKKAVTSASKGSCPLLLSLAARLLAIGVGGAVILLPSFQVLSQPPPSELPDAKEAPAAEEEAAEEGPEESGEEEEEAEDNKTDGSEVESAEGDDSSSEEVMSEAPEEEEPEPYEPAKAPSTPSIETVCQGKRIRRVLVQGARRVAKEDVLATMRLGPRDLCVDEAVSRDVRALWDLGFFDDIVIRARERGPKAIDLIVQVQERPAIGKVVFNGNDEVDDEDIEEKITLEEGEILSVPEVESQITEIRDLYAEEGFFLAKVTYELRKIDKENKEVEVRFNIVEGPEVKVRRVRFTGNRKIKTEELQKIMQTRETGFFSFISSNDKFNRDAFRDDVTRIQAYYYDKGYLSMRLGTPRIEITPDRRFIDVTIPVTEGKRYRIGKIVVEEIDASGKKIKPIGGAKALREEIDAEGGEWFSRSTFAEGVQVISRRYKDHGYAQVEVNPVTDLRPGKLIVDVTVRIRRGPKVRIERINILGNSKTRDLVIRRELNIAEGDWYSQTKIERSRNRVEALGYFETVTVAEEAGSSRKRVILNFEVAERSTGQFQVGAGFSSVESILLNAQVQQENFLGRGYTLGFQLQLSGIRRLFQVRFVEPYLLGTRWSLGLEVFRNVRQFQDFVQRSTGGAITFGHPIVDDRLRFSLRYRAENVVIDPRTGGAFGFGAGQGFSIFQRLPLSDLYQDGFISSVRFGLSWDDRNNRLFPSEGIFLSGSTEVADNFTGSQNIFTRQTFIARFYKKLFGGMVLKFNNEWGLITSREEEGVPIFIRYFLGGIFSIRGYSFNSIGPRAGLTRALDPNSSVDPQGVVIGGNLQAFYNLELEFPIVDSVGIKGVVFHDGGNAWNLENTLCDTPASSITDPAADPCSVDIWRIRTSWGFGVRWFSPLGPLRFEWGIPIRRREFEDRIRFEFTIGNFF